MSNDLKPYLHEYAAFSQTALYGFLEDRRRESTHRQVDELIRAGVQSTDPLVRAIATAIVKDGAMWALFGDFRDALNESEGRPAEPEVEKQHKDYTVPGFASEFMPI